MNIKNSTINDVLEITPEVFIDHRGTYIETFNENNYKKICCKPFLQDDISSSRLNVLRGLHGDNSTWKLVSCIFGQIYLVVLDLRENSDTYNKWQSFILSHSYYKQILIPPGCANGHLVLSESAIFHYKQSTYYNKNQFTVRWNDPKYNIWWPISNPILSRRDEFGKYIE